MLRISDSEMRLTSHGYHFDDNGRKYVRVWTSLNFIKIQVKIQPHKEMHIKSIDPNFPYVITNNWVEMTIPYHEIPKCCEVVWMNVEVYIDMRCKEIWFV